MSLPKGIYSNPLVREAWIEERRAKLDTFDRLTGKGMSASHAARAIGTTPGGVRATRDGLHRLEDGWTTGKTKGERIDLGLALLSVANPPGPNRATLSTREIAAWCGCSHAGIQSIEKRALRKLHRRLNAVLREQVIVGEFAEADTLARPLHLLATAA